MSRVVVDVQGLGKKYYKGRSNTSSRNFREIITDTTVAPFRRVARLLRGESGGAGDLQDIHWALKDVSFSVAQGEVFGIIGANGSGKSTLLKILSRITQPTQGVVRIKGRIASLLEVGTGFHPELTGRENIYLNGTLLGMRRREIQRCFDEIIDFSGVERFIDTPVKYYSSGMYVRLAFSVAAHLNSDILLVDEILSVGDAAFQEKSLGKIDQAANIGRTVLFVSHNLSAVRGMCSNSLLLDRGRVQHIGSTNECLEHYLRQYSQLDTPDVDTSDAPRTANHFGQQLRITRTRLQTPRVLPLVYTDEDIVLKMEFSTNQILTDLVFGWAFFTNDRIRLFDALSVDTYAPVERIEPGRYSISCRISASYFMPGDYMLTPGVRSLHGGLDFVLDALKLRIETREESTTWHSLGTRTGLVLLPAEWKAYQKVP